MSEAGVPPMFIRMSDLFPVPGFNMQLQQSLQVSHLGVSLWGIAVLLQLGEVEGTLSQRFTLSLVQFASYVDQPGRKVWENK